VFQLFSVDGTAVGCVLAFGSLVEEFVLFVQQRELVVEGADEAVDLELMALEQQLHDSLVPAIARLHACGTAARRPGAAGQQCQRCADLFAVFCVLDLGAAMRSSPSVRQLLDLLPLKGPEVR
jgi:hypothetical protein